MPISRGIASCSAKRWQDIKDQPGEYKRDSGATMAEVLLAIADLAEVSKREV